MQEILVRVVFNVTRLEKDSTAENIFSSVE